MATIAEKMAFILLLSCAIPAAAQKRNVPPPARLTVSRTVYEGDSITRVDFYPLRVYPPLTFKSRRSERAYYKLVRDVKRTLPLARMINQILIETYEYMQTLPEGKAREEHIKRVEKGLKEQYTPMMKINLVGCVIVQASGHHLRLVGYNTYGLTIHSGKRGNGILSPVL